MEHVGSLQHAIVVGKQGIERARCVVAANTLLAGGPMALQHASRRKPRCWQRPIGRHQDRQLLQHAPCISRNVGSLAATRAKQNGTSGCNTLPAGNSVAGFER
jgi:hypothetical protein